MNSQSVQTRGNREMGIELYRVFLTFLICLIHAISFGPLNRPWATSAITFSVCGFVFISGWFGIRFTVSKMLRLLCLSLFCGLVAYCIGRYAGFELSRAQVVEVFYRMWFLDAYLVLMLFSPILNLAVRNIKSDAVSVSIALAVLIGWNWIASTSFGVRYAPTTQGLGAYTFVMMICVYMIARVLRLVYDRNRAVIDAVPTPVLLSVFIGLVAICGLGWRFCLGLYSSPIAMATAAAGFFVFKRIPVMQWGGAIRMVAPSMFSVILLHSHVIGANLICRFEEMMAWPRSWVACAWLVTGIAIFVVCLSIDSLRRICLIPLRPMVNAPCDKVDEVCRRLFDMIIGGANWLVCRGGY